MEKHIRHVARGALAVYWVCLALATHWPSSKLPGNVPTDKWLHFTAYALLAVLFTVVVAEWLRGLLFGRLWTWWLVIIVVLSGYGLFDEATQPITRRNFDWWDWAADVAGAVFATTLLMTGMCVSRQWLKLVAVRHD